MARLSPVKRRELIRRLERLGFEGPYTGGNHEYMVRNGVRVAIPNPHSSDIGVGLLSRILKQAGVSRKEWENV